jgi:hypothetical protein
MPFSLSIPGSFTFTGIALASVSLIFALSSLIDAGLRGFFPGDFNSRSFALSAAACASSRVRPPAGVMLRSFLTLEPSRGSRRGTYGFFSADRRSASGCTTSCSVSRVGWTLSRDTKGCRNVPWLSRLWCRLNLSPSTNGRGRASIPV